jgi:hypothetical protein
MARDWKHGLRTSARSGDDSIAVSGIEDDNVVFANAPLPIDSKSGAPSINPAREAVSNDLQVRSFDGSESTGGMPPLARENASAVTVASASGFTTDTSAGSESVAKPVSNTVTVIDAGATLELAHAYSGTISFAGSTGTLIIDHSSSFAGTISGQLGTGNVIDLADITGGAAVTIAYSGNNSPGVLTVTDGTHTATIALTGNYSLANFTASSDGHGGTLVIDPPVLPPGVTLKAIDGGSTYYASHGLTYAANAGWDSTVVPVGLWVAPMLTQADANRWLDLNLNTMFGMTSNSSLALLRANGLWAVEQSNEIGAILASNAVRSAAKAWVCSQQMSRPITTMEC